MEECLKSIDSDINLSSLFEKLNALADSITSDTVEIDKDTAKTVLTAFLNNWKFASKEDSALLEGYFSLLVSVNFFEKITKPFLKLVTINHGHRSVKWAYRMFRIACILYTQEVPALADSVLDMKVHLIEEIAEQSPRLGNLAVSYMISTSNTNTKEESDAYLDKAIDVCIKSRESLLLAACYLYNGQQIEASRTNSFKLLVKNYLAILSGARKTPSSCVVRAGGMIVSLATHDSLTNDIFPALSRAIKRNADMALPCMLTCIKELKVDASRYLTFLVDTCMHMMKEEKPEVNDDCYALLTTLISHSSDCEAIISFINMLLKEMESNRLTPALKKQVYSGIQVILSHVNEKIAGKSAVTQLGQTMSDIMIKYVTKESNVNVKLMCYICLGVAVRLSNEVSSDVMKLLESNATTANFKQGIVYLLYQSCLTSCTSFDTKRFIPLITSLIENALSKPFIFGRDGIVALPCLIRLCELEGCPLPDVIHKVFNEDSFIHQPSIVFSSNRDDDIIVGCCHESILSIMTMIIKSHCVDNQEEQAMIQLIYLIMTQAKAVTKRQILSILQSLSLNETSLLVLLKAYQAWLIKASLASPSAYYDDEYPYSRDVLISILHTLAHGRITNDNIAIFAWCSSHLYLHGEKNTIAWKSVYAIMKSYLKDMQLTEGNNTFILSLLHDDILSVTSSNPILAKTAQITIENLASIPDFIEPLYALLQPELLTLSSSTAINDVTAQDLAIWKTPAFVEWKEEDESGYSVEIKQTKPKNRKGNSDEAWAAALQAELNKDKIAKAEAEKAIAAHNAVLEEQAVIRARVNVIANEYRTVLYVVRALIQGGCSHFVDNIMECVMMVNKLLTNGLVSEFACEVYEDCCDCIEDKSMRDLIKNCLYHVFFKQFYSTSLLNNTSRLFTITTGLLSTTSFPSFYLPLFLPILKAVTFSKECSSLHQSVMVILSSFTEKDDDYTTKVCQCCRYEVLEILLELLLIAPKLDPSPESVMMSYCDHEPALLNNEVLLLLGDHGMLSSSEDVRLNSLINLASLSTDKLNVLYITRLFMSQFDEDEDIAEEAQQQWEEKEMNLIPSFYLPLFILLGHNEKKIRYTAARGIAAGLVTYPNAVQNVINSILKKYNDIQAIEDEEEKKGMLGTTIALFYLIEQCALKKVFSVEQLYEVCELLVTLGFSDNNDAIRVQAMKAGEVLMEQYGDSQTQELLHYLNEKLLAMEKDADTEEEACIQDHQREGCIILLGKVTCFLQDGDERIITTTHTLIKSLSIPSASVQDAVAHCLTPLFKYECLRAEAKTFIDYLLKQLTEGSDYATRHGAAVGLAGAIKGMSSKAFKEFNINGFIENAAQSDSNIAREGAMLALGALFDSLTFMFEPYVVKYLPLLLENFSSKDEGVRFAAQDASRSVMRNLSPHGVKLVMPKVLEGLNDSRWRTKQVAIEMLGSMAYCSPHSLSSCLPRIVPVLTESCNDAHNEIQDSAKNALMDIVNVIRTPEIADLQQVLLKALTEPHLFTGSALRTLTETSFRHTIDAPSLALIVPILMRGLSDRTTDTKKKAALIVGNICSLANRDDVLPYLPKLLPPLKKCLMDPLPDVRAVVAHSIGMLSHEVGEEEMKDTLEWLIEMIYEDSTVAERSGAAQGLADMLASVSTQRFNEVLNELLENSKHPRACVREGVMWTISFLPSTLGKRFTSLLSLLLPSIVAGLADESDMVAEVALRAGQVIVKSFATTELAQILPPIRDAMMDDDWRIRQSSIMLMGELLYTLGKTKAVGMSEDENMTGLSNDNVEGLLQKELGMQTWIEVMASLFYLTTDVTAAVRQSAFQVWKSVVNNTPRTLKKLLGELTQLCFKMFTSDSENKRTLAARCLGEIVQKLGEFVIPHVLKVLNQGMENDDAATRQIVCIGFVQVLSNCSNSVIKTWGNEFLKSLQVSICDDNEEVRAAAAQALTLLQNKGNGNAFDSILPLLLTGLEGDNEAEQHRALNGLKQIIILQGKQIIQNLFTKLTATPLTIQHLHVLCAIIPSTSKYLHYFITDLTTQFLEVLCGHNDENEDRLEDIELATALHDTLRAIVVNIQTCGVQWAMTCLDKISNMENNGYRREACTLIGAFCQETTADYSEQIQIILRCLIKRSADSDYSVIEAAWKALSILLTKNKVDDMLKYVPFISNMIATVISTERYKPGVDMNTYILPAFEMKEGLKPLFTLLQKGIMIASAERKADCAALICDLVQYAPPQNVRLYALQVTGPLIRIIGDKYAPEVREKIYQALNALLSKASDALRPFIPQLQTTFLRALKDSCKGVREQGSQALVHIIKISNRIDNVVNDLSNDIINNETEIRENIMISLQNIMIAVGTKLQPATRTTVENRMLDLLFNEEADIRVLAAGVLGVCLTYTDDELFKSIVLTNILSNSISSLSVEEQHGRCTALGQLLKYNADRSIQFHNDIIHNVTDYLKSDNLLVRKCAISVCKYVLNAYNTMSEDSKRAVLDELIAELTSCIYDTNSTIRYDTVISISLFGKVCKDTHGDLLGALVPTLLKSVQDSYVPVKLASERALLHLLQIHENPDVLDNYIRSIPPMDAKYLKTYVQRVLIKLPKSSDDDIGDF